MSEAASAVLDLVEAFEKNLSTEVNLEQGWTTDGTGPATSRAVVVMGPTRGGTSAVAGVLHHLGVRMREKALAGPANPLGTFEDSVFLGIQLHRPDCRQLDARDARRYAMAIRQRNSNFALWGVKEPRLAFIIENLLPFFEDVRFVFVARDLRATKASYTRWEKEVDAPSIDEQMEAIGYCAVTLSDRYPTVGVHYEALLAEPELHVGRLAQFAYDDLDIMPTEWAVLRAIRSIKPELRHF